MKNINKLSKVVAATLGTVATLGMLPQATAETVSLDATVDVLNTFSLVQDSAISFGVVRATASTDAANTAYVVLPASPTGAITNDTTTGANSTSVPAMSVLTAGAPGQYTVSGAAAFTSLNISVDSNSVNLVGSGIPPAKPSYFTLGSLTMKDATNPAKSLSSTPDTLTTLADGSLVFTVGGTLTTADNADTVTDFTDGNYQDGTYSGSLTLTVEY
jgi:hypothetical protein